MRAPSKVLAAIAVALSALTGASAAQAATTVDVRIRDFAFGPSYTRVEPGDSVRWIQTGSLHTVTSRAGAPERFNSGQLLFGKEFVRAFPTAGRYPYHCTIHPEMRGVVQVGPDTTAPALTRIRVVPAGRSPRVAFSLSETAEVSLRVAAKARPRKILRRTRARMLDEGRRSIAIAFRGLAPGSYKLTLKAVDREDNAKVAAAGSWRISAP